MAAGAISTGLKVVIVFVGILYSFWLGLSLAIQNIVFPSAIAGAVDAYRKKTGIKEIPAALARGGMWYIRAVMVFLFSMGAVGIIVIGLPLHANMSLTLVMSLAALVQIAHAIYSKRKSLWPALVNILSVGVIATGVAYFAYTAIKGRPPTRSDFLGKRAEVVVHGRGIRAPFPPGYLPPGGTIWLRAGDKTRRCFSAAGVVFLSGGKVRVISNDHIALEGVFSVGKTDRGWEYILDVDGYKKAHGGGRLRIQDMYPFCLDIEAEEGLQLAAKT
ncbi:MAG: hypothetical protein HYU35_00155 [Parcubacteria group bacterium]|nr:hypothetical protein [Parcubacteria group bacterium]